MDIDAVVDVGANVGQYAIGLRQAGFQGDIISFEPVLASFQELARNAARDPRWHCRNIALGSRRHIAEIHVLGDSRASSLLQPSSRPITTPTVLEQVGTQEVTVETLDQEIAGLAPDTRLYLKLDVEGYEREVLEGAPRALSRALAIELELSLVPLWEGSPVFFDMIKYVTHLGFRVASVECVTESPRSGEMFQVDGIFMRRDTNTPGSPGSRH
ncbi:FkbM family methyltransferase [Streptomyces cupreus]|uniref:FkbM family methyltransferase n=1 Tax=Streptomyces cupreus TaxID=2759956 RepID=A0A7X1MB94_9ACTN|nr:FkbM family methyltransferase [Streptomyces cupreus]MBC2902395.1 FkbM family methyltransferase [Streptomyces cupreus]